MKKEEQRQIAFLPVCCPFYVNWKGLLALKNSNSVVSFFWALLEIYFILIKVQVLPKVEQKLDFDRTSNIKIGKKAYFSKVLNNNNNTVLFILRQISDTQGHIH